MALSVAFRNPQITSKVFRFVYKGSNRILVLFWSEKSNSLYRIAEKTILLFSGNLPEYYRNPEKYMLSVFCIVELCKLKILHFLLR